MKPTVQSILVTAMSAFTVVFSILVFCTACRAETDTTYSIEQKNTGAPSISNPAAMISNDALAGNIQEIANADTTFYSVYVCYPLENRAEYIFQNGQMRSASMIKVFILGCAMEDVSKGRLSLNQKIILRDYDKVGGSGILAGYAGGTEFDLDTILRYMITESDNTATNIMIDILGMDAINEYIRQNGYRETILQRKMMDMKAAEAGLDNFTSVVDLGHFFHKLYNRNCVTPELDDIMLSYLAGQTDTECFPSALPGIMVAHKTGELAGLYNDGGIVYNGENPFILVIMTENYSSRYNAIKGMQKMAVAAAYHAAPL